MVAAITGAVRVSAICFAISACAAYRGGWESLPYVGEAVPQPPPVYRAPFEAARRCVLEMDGLRLRVRIDNTLRTYETKFVLFVIPVSVDATEVYSASPTPGRTRVRMDVLAGGGGFVFRPDRAILRVDGLRFRGAAGYEFGRWNDQGTAVAAGARLEQRPVAGELRLGDDGRHHLLAVEFETPTPAPERSDIELDLSEALRAPGRSPLPVIRFAPVRWREGYTDASPPRPAQVG